MSHNDLGSVIVDRQLNLIIFKKKKKLIKNFIILFFWKGHHHADKTSIPVEKKILKSNFYTINFPFETRNERKIFQLWNKTLRLTIKFTTKNLLIFLAVFIYCVNDDKIIFRMRNWR